ncbi:MAG: hypothetical protein WD851_06105 [Pirellulales bacterium]
MSFREHVRVTGDDRVGQVAFLLLQLQYFFFDRVLGDEAIGEDVNLRSDSAPLRT